jgi:hypothetical protein
MIRKRTMLISIVWASVAVASGHHTHSGTGAVVEPTAEDKALAARVEAIAKISRGTPGQEAANFLLGEWPRDLIPLLKGEEKATADELSSARSAVSRVLETAEKGPAWPKPETMRVPLARKAPIIDGKLDDPAWKDAFVMTGVYVYDEKERREAPATTWRILWDREYLYFAFECADEDIEARPMRKDGPVYEDDCVEIYLLPDFSSGLYWEIVISPTGNLFDSLQSKRFNGYGCVSDTDKNLQGIKIGHTVNGTVNNSSDKDTGYVVEVAVPFCELPSYTGGKLPAVGQTLYFMISRFDKTGNSIKHYAFQPLLSWGHNIWNYAPMELVK